MPRSLPAVFLLSSEVIHSSNEAKKKGSEYSYVKFPPPRIRFNPKIQTVVPIKAGARPNCFRRRWYPSIVEVDRNRSSINHTPQRVPIPISSAIPLIKNIPGGLLSQAVIKG